MIGRGQPPQVSDDPADTGIKGYDDFEVRLGDVMRGERATMGKSLLDIQRELKIRATYIAAIENADPSAFETPGFVAGYVRSYARYLGLDPEWAYETFCEEGNFESVHGMDAAASGQAAQRRKHKAAKKADPLNDPNATFVPRGDALLSRIEPRAIGSVLVLCLLISGLGFGALTVLKEIQRVELTPVEQAPGVAAQVAPLSIAAALPETVDGSQDAQLSRDEALAQLYRPQPLDVPVLVARDGPISALPPGSLGALAGSNAPQPPQLASVAPDAPVTAPEAVESNVVVSQAPDYPEMAIAALRPAWIRVTAADGAVLFEKILDAGESYTLPVLDEPARLRAGNSSAVYFVVNGEAYGPAAPDASVVKDVPLASALVRDLYQSVDPTQDDVATMVAGLRSKWDADSAE